MLESTEGYSFPDPDAIYERQREEASFAYLIPFVTIIGGLPLPIVNLLVCVIYWRYAQKKPPFVRFHALQSLFTTVPIVLINAGVVFILANMFWGDLEYASWMGGYFAAAAVFNLIEFIFNVYAAINARKGRSFLFIGFGALAYRFTDWNDLREESFL